MKYTGERVVPGEGKLQALLVEDLSKYVFASQYLSGKAVLDAGCGAGQGAHYIAEHGAQSVIAIDLDYEAIAFAREQYPRDNLRFAVMNVECLAFPDQTFDAVTSMEVIEHLWHYDQYVAGIARVLRPGGLYILSTPNKLISSPTPGTVWPFHVHEFYPDELQALLAQHFADVEMWGLEIPAYDRHVARRAMHWLAPLFKPILPRVLRLRSLATLQRMIKADLDLRDIVISREQVAERSTTIVICRR